MRRYPLFITLLVAALVLGLVITAPVFAKGGGGNGGGAHTETATNNLSFPAIAVDGFTITPIGGPSFIAPYTGLYSGLSAAEIAYLVANGPWYEQKTQPDNVWQAEYAVETAVAVTEIDWGDNIESINPTKGRPFRLEVVLFKGLVTPMTAYNMAVLEYPSSLNELQGTDTTTFQSGSATVISTQPRLVIQYLGATKPALTWEVDKWLFDSDTTSYPPTVSVGFGPELNVAGKYIFGASGGGWKPANEGWYRITFYVPQGSGVDLRGAVINPPAEEGAALPVVGWTDPDTAEIQNLTYVDVLVKAGGGGGKH